MLKIYHKLCATSFDLLQGLLSVADLFFHLENATFLSFERSHDHGDFLISHGERRLTLSENFCKVIILRVLRGGGVYNLNILLSFWLHLLSVDIIIVLIAVITSVTRTVTESRVKWLVSFWSINFFYNCIISAHFLFFFFHFLDFFEGPSPVLLGFLYAIFDFFRMLFFLFLGVIVTFKSWFQLLSRFISLMKGFVHPFILRWLLYVFFYFFPFFWNIYFLFLFHDWQGLHVWLVLWLMNSLSLWRILLRFVLRKRIGNSF